MVFIDHGGGGIRQYQTAIRMRNLFDRSVDTICAMSDLRAAVGDATTTLVCASAGDGCTELLPAVTADTTVLWVTYTHSPETCIERYCGDGSLSVIAVGEAASGGDVEPDSVTVRTVSTPGDLTRLGITLSQTLTDRKDTVVCFDSLTALLQYVDCETAYEFLNAVTGHLWAADATAHFHLDSTAHDTQTVDALASLFDAIAAPSDDGWSARTRISFD